MSSLRGQARTSKNAEHARLTTRGHEMTWTATRVWHSIRGAGYDGECTRCGMTVCLFRDPWGGASAGYRNREGRPCWGGRKCPRARRARR